MRERALEFALDRCPQCGKQSFHGLRHCPNCGAELPREDAPPKHLIKIARVVNRLDRVVPRQDAFVVRLDDPEAIHYGGNREGYLRLGIEFLKGAVASSESGSNELLTDLQYLIEPQPECRCYFSLLNERPPAKKDSGWREVFGEMFAMAIAVAFFIVPWFFGVHSIAVGIRNLLP